MSREPPSRLRLVRIALLTVATCPLACDFEPSDVSLDPFREDSAARPPDRDAESGPANRDDASSNPPAVPSGGAGGRRTPPVAGSGGIDEPDGTTAQPPHPLPPMDSGTDASDASPGLDGAQTDAPPPPDADLIDEDTGTDEEDTGTDEPPAGPEGPCNDGTFRCIPAEVSVIGNFTTTLIGADVTGSCAGHTFPTIALNGPIHTLMLPVECPVWVHAAADGYWESEQSVLFGPQVAAFEGGGIAVFSTDLINAVLAPLQQVIDEKKGLVSVYVYPAIAGVGISIGQPSDPPNVTDAAGNLVLGDALIDGGNGVIAFVNVEPGPLTLVPFGPEGIACFPLVPADYVAKSHTTTTVNLVCVAAGP